MLKKQCMYPSQTPLSALISRLWWTSFSSPPVILCFLMQRIELLRLLLCVVLFSSNFRPRQLMYDRSWWHVSACIYFFSIHIPALSFMRTSSPHLTRLEIWYRSLTQIGIETFYTHLRQCDMQLTCKIVIAQCVCTSPPQHLLLCYNSYFSFLVR